MRTDLPTDSATVRAGRREWIGLAVLSLPALLASLELTVTHLALPSIGTDLDASSAEQLWIVDIYAFLLAGSMLALGSIGDMIGRRRLLMIGGAAFAVASVAAAYAPNVEVLIVLRALMGVAGATLMPSILSLTTAMFREPNQRRIAVGAVIASVSVGTAIGPLVGGRLLDSFWWGSVFLIGLPIMGLMLVLAPWFVPERRAERPPRIDVVSGLMTVGSVLPVIYALKMISTGHAALPAYAAGLFGLVLGAFFLRRQRRLDEPMVDLQLFRRSPVAAGLLTLALGIFVLWGTNYAIAQYFQLVRGLDPLEAGLWTAPSAVGVIAGSTLAPHLVKRFRAASVIAAGLLVSAVGFVLLTRVETQQGLGTVVVGSIVVSAGLGPMMALATEMIVSSAPLKRAASASAMASMAPQLGGAIGIAVLGSVVAAVYRQRVDAAISDQLTASQAADAKDSLVAAYDVSRGLDAPYGDDLLQRARDAFTDGFQLSAGLSAMIMLALAVAVITMLRPTERPHPTTPDPSSAGASRERLPRGSDHAS